MKEITVLNRLTGTTCTWLCVATALLSLLLHLVALRSVSLWMRRALRSVPVKDGPRYGLFDGSRKLRASEHNSRGTKFWFEGQQYFSGHQGSKAPGPTGAVCKVWSSHRDTVSLDFVDSRRSA